MFKKVCTITVLIAIICFTFSSSGNAAQEGIILSVQSKEAGIGKEFEVAIEVTPNSNISTGSFNIKYNPSILAPVESIPGELINNFITTNNIHFKPDTIRVNWASLSTISDQGNLYKIKFITTSEIKPQKTDIALEDILLVDINSDKLYYQVKNGMITLSKPFPIVLVAAFAAIIVLLIIVFIIFIKRKRRIKKTRSQIRLAEPNVQ